VNIAYPDAIPVITTAGKPLGYVYPAAAVHEHWWVVGADGYRSPFPHRSRAAAVMQLCRLSNHDPMEIVDPQLTAALAHLGGQFGALAVALTAARLTDPAAVVGQLLAEQPGDLEESPQPGPTLERDVLRRVITGLLGPHTAREVLTAYDSVAGCVVPVELVTAAPVRVEITRGGDS